MQTNDFSTGTGTANTGRDGLPQGRGAAGGLAEPRAAGASPRQDGAEEEGKPGRPSGYSSLAQSLLCSVIKETGISDSAAALRLGMSTSSVSRWKAEHPELGTVLAQAREEFRAAQLDRVLKAAAQAETGRGWRGAAWLLERIFPMDYAKAPGHRDHYERREERHRNRQQAEEELALIDHQLAVARAQTAAAAEAAFAQPPQVVRTAEPARPEAPASTMPDEATAAPCAEAVHSPTHGGSGSQAGEGEGRIVPFAPDACFYSEGDSHNSRNPILSGPMQPAGMAAQPEAANRAT